MVQFFKQFPSFYVKDSFNTQLIFRHIDNKSNLLFIIEKEFVYPIWNCSYWSNDVYLSETIYFLSTYT